MAEEKNPKLERALEVVEPGRRDALRRILTAAYAAPVVASFSLDALAADDAVCLASNFTGDYVLFRGEVECKGFSFLLQTLSPFPGSAVRQKFEQKFEVDVRLTEIDAGGYGFIGSGPSTLVSPSPVSVKFLLLEGEKDDVLGFTATECDRTQYWETGQWKWSTDKHGKQKLTGKSWVTMRSLSLIPSVSYSLECEYDLVAVPPTV